MHCLRKTLHIYIAPTQEHDISPSVGISNQLQHGQAHELTKKRSSVISSQGVEFLNVVQEPVVAYTILGNTQKQPFTSLESTTTYAKCELDSRWQIFID